MPETPKKVLHVLNSAGGGAALSTIDLIESLRQEGIEACAVCHDAGTSSERERLREATRGEVLFDQLYWSNRKIRAKTWKRPLLEALQILRTGWARHSAHKVTAFAKSHDADLIHTNTILTPEGGLAARSLGLPHVWHLRELVGPRQPFRLAHEGPAFGRYLAAHCSKLIANSHASADCVRDWLRPGLLEVIPNGIDVSRFVSRSDFSSDRPIVVAMVGSLSSRTKKHALFIEAATRTDPTLSIEFRIYGHDPSRGQQTSSDDYANKIHELVRQHGLTDRFAFMGHVADPIQVMSEIDVLVHPADNESFGRIVVEAMAAGLPVVGVRGGGVNEIVVDRVSGFLSEPDDPGQLGVFIEQLVCDPDLRRMLGNGGRQRAISEYSLASCSAGVLRVYQLAMQRPLTNSRTERRNDASPVTLSTGRKAVVGKPTRN
jgi:glycosyltransferase involved in cell wall biosynthesis